ncbi:hypothetical protein HDU67_005330 [Dinochytrium kinnereticum]|nr:hypothetical protein HDU67_005330 [Dinochytrium kinnereticum]
MSIKDQVTELSDHCLKRLRKVLTDLDLDSCDPSLLAAHVLHRTVTEDDLDEIDKEMGDSEWFSATGYEPAQITGVDLL